MVGGAGDGAGRREHRDKYYSGGWGFVVRCSISAEGAISTTAIMIPLFCSVRKRFKIHRARFSEITKQ